jgi:hydrogenase nickel incorporation protein HypB
MYKIIEVKQSVFEDNNKDANKLREECKDKGVFLLNVMSSPGAGKTTTLSRTLERLKDRMRIGIMEADIDSDVDAKTISEYGVRTIQLHIGGMCHLDADMTRQGLHEMGMEDLDLAVLENVGNLVCPAEFDTGSTKNVTILSVPEGDDKPLKYPLMFQVCDVVLINKMDVLPYFDFDVEKCKKNILYRNPNAKIFEVCAKTGEGIDDWCKWLENEVKAWKE